MEEIKQQDCFWAETGTSGALYSIPDPVHREVWQPDKGDEKQVWVVDVSLTGAHFITDTDIWLELGKEYMLRFQLNKTEMTLCVKIIRIAALLDKPIEYGCVFCNLQDREKAELCRCLYQIQMMERKRKMSMVT